MRMDDIMDVYERLCGTGIPFSFNHIPREKTPPLPYGIYLTERANPFYADGQVYFLFGHLQVELYSGKKDPTLEAEVENALSGLAWTKEEEFLSNEKCYLVTYELEVKNNGE